MRIMTADEVSKELHDIKTRKWPLSVLFMKNLYERHPPNIGYIERKGDVIVPAIKTVRHHEGRLIPYETLKTMVEDGWIAD
jgi:hypothetical protein